MKVLIACEESQAVCIAFRERGHEAYSCDIQPCSGGHPEWHIMDDALRIINGDVVFKDSGGGIPSHLRTMGFDNRTSALHIPFKCCNSFTFPPMHSARKDKRKNEGAN